MIEDRLKEIKNRCEAATEVVYKLCKDPKEFRMCIPVRTDDTDVVLCNALRDSEMLLEMVEFLVSDMHMVCSHFVDQKYRIDVLNKMPIRLEKIAEKYSESKD